PRVDYGSHGTHRSHEAPSSPVRPGDPEMNRRDFLSAGAAGLAISATGVHVSAQEKKPRVGLIGCGWYGKCDITQLLKIAPVEIVSLCDVDKKMLADAADIFAQREKSNKKPKTFTDYREMLKEEDLDIVEIATPDHWHALPMIAACEAVAAPHPHRAKRRGP